MWSNQLLSDEMEALQKIIRYKEFIKVISKEITFILKPLGKILSILNNTTSFKQLLSSGGVTFVQNSRFSP
jgi:hypothetical protein